MKKLELNAKKDDTYGSDSIIGRYLYASGYLFEIERSI
jgi:hypothetical protein